MGRDNGNPVLDEDLDRLADQTCCTVELLCNGEQRGIVVCALELPTGIYNRPRTDLLMQTTTQYPASAMDMFWVDHDLTLHDGGIPTGAESVETYFSRQWRRFSWHRNVPWQPGRDDLVGHFEFVVARLQRPE